MKIDINEVMAQLAQAFNTTVDSLYPLLIKQAYISGMLNLFFATLTITACVLFLVIVRRKWEDIERSDADIFVGFGGFILAILAVIVIPLCTYEAITTLANPEYWALKEVLNAIGGSK